MAGYVDQDAKVSRAAKKPRLGVREAKDQAAAVAELDTLLNLLHDPHDLYDHYDFPFQYQMDQFCEGIKWAFGEFPEKGLEKLWYWWEKPMHSLVNKTWMHAIKVRDGQEIKGDNLFGHKEDQEKFIEEAKANLEETYEKVMPKKASYEEMKKWITYKVGQKGCVLNPGCKDATLSDLVIKYLQDKFVMLDPEGTSVVFDEEKKLWILRKKDRSAIALGAVLRGLKNKNVKFTDQKAEENWDKRVLSSGSMQSVLTWLRGTLTEFPHPVKAKLDANPFLFPLKDGKVADIRTLEVRTRTSADYFTICSNITWLEDHKSVGPGTPMIMERDGVEKFKTVQKDEEKVSILQLLCPNAMKFLRGPFIANEARFIFMLKKCGQFLSTKCTRKGVWIYGDGQGMKSTVFEAIVNLMGPFAVILHKKVFFSSPGSESGHNTDLMRAESKRLVVVDELERKDSLKESLFKVWTAHGSVSAREIYGGQGEWKPLGMSVFISQPVVTLQFTDASISDRLLPVRATTRVFTSSDQKLPPKWEGPATWTNGWCDQTKLYWILKDPDEELWAQAFMKPEEEKGYMNELGCLLILCSHWAYQEMEKKENRGALVIPPVIAQDFQQFVQESDPVGQYLHEMVIIDLKAATAYKSVWDDYRKWCTDSGVKSMETKLFRSSLHQKGLIFEDRLKYTDKRTGKTKKCGKTFWARVLLKSQQPIIVEPPAPFTVKPAGSGKEELKEKEKRVEKIIEDTEKYQKEIYSLDWVV